MENIDVIILAGAMVLFIGLLLGTLSPRVGVPTLLAFLAVGIAAGEDGIGKIQFEDVDTVFLISNLALAIILLDGGLRTRLEHFRVALKPALTLATLGVVLPAALTGAFATWLLGVDWRIGLLVGGIIGSTDAAAVFSMIRSSGVRLNERVSSTLEMESGLNDPMAIFITVMLIELITNPAMSWGLQTLGMLVQQFGVGVLMGILLGIALAELLVRVRGNEGLHALLLCTGGLTIWALANMLGGSGFLAAYIAGLMAGNWRQGTSDNVLRSMDSMAWLSQSGLFLMLGLLVTPREMLESLVPGLCIAAFLMLVARPLATWLLLKPFNYPKSEQIFIAWTGLRGAVPVVLAVFPLVAGIEESRQIFNIVFVVVMASLLLQGMTLGPLARKLKLALPHAAQPINEVELAGLDDRFIVQYAVGADSKADGRSLDLIPPTTQLLALSRAGAPLECDDHTTLQAGDILTLMTTPADQTPMSEWLHASPQELRTFYGDFIVNSSVPVADLLDNYGLSGVSERDASLTLEQYFQEHHRGQPVLGDAVELVGLRLRARVIEGGRVTRFGIRLPHAH